MHPYRGKIAPITPNLLKDELYTHLKHKCKLMSHQVNPSAGLADSPTSCPHGQGKFCFNSFSSLLTSLLETH